MDERQLKQYFASLYLGGLRYYDTTGSTNDQALAWAAQGAQDFSLVIADEQSKGRGRMDRIWFTPPHSALAMSLVLRPTESERAHPARTTGLLALSLSDSLRKLGLAPEIKWPNDVLLNGRKAAGILVEAVWSGEDLEALVLGMGVNVLSASVPPARQLLFPATSIETELGHPVDRFALLKEILQSVLNWRLKIGTEAFLDAWEGNLAYRGQQVQVQARSGEAIICELIGLNPDGSLRVRDERDNYLTVQYGEVHLRPVA